jgi:hypothetical protein
MMLAESNQLTSNLGGEEFQSTSTEKKKKKESMPTQQAGSKLARAGGQIAGQGYFSQRMCSTGCCIKY